VIFGRKGAKPVANPYHRGAQTCTSQADKRWLNVFVMKNRKKARGAYAGFALPIFARVSGDFCSANSSTAAT
jgi:hypothetical protein